MTVEIRVPVLGESLTTAIVARWLKQPGDYVQHDETILELETDKVSVEVPAPTSGVLEACVVVGTEVEIGSVLGAVDETASAPVREAAPKPEPVIAAEPTPVPEKPVPPKSPEPVAVAARTPAAEIPSSSDTRERRVPLSRLRQTIARNLKVAQSPGIRDGSASRLRRRCSIVTLKTVPDGRACRHDTYPFRVRTVEEW